MGTHFSKRVGGGGGGHHNGVLSGHEIMAYAFLSGTQVTQATYNILNIFTIFLQNNNKYCSITKGSNFHGQETTITKLLTTECCLFTLNRFQSANKTSVQNVHKPYPL